MSTNLDDLFDVLDCEDESSDKFGSALTMMEALADAGSSDAAEAIAEIYAFSSHHRDPAKAYFWYHVALATQGFATSFANRHDTLEQYYGPDGDFRNEGQVNGLLAELGEARVRDLDRLASEWLRKHAVP